MGGNKSKQVSTELTDKQIALLLANTKYSEKDIRDWHEGFIRDCPNGLLDKKKFVELYKGFYPNGKPDNYCKYAFNTFDINKDGTINFEEFLVTIAVTSQGSLDDRLAATFNVYDISKDGQIDQNELTTLISAMYDLVGQTERKGEYDPRKRAGDIIAKLDVTGDGKLSKEEFITGCKLDLIIRQILAPNV